MRSSKRFLALVLGLLAVNGVLLVKNANAATERPSQVCVWMTDHNGGQYQGCTSWPFTTCGGDGCNTWN